MNNVLCYTLDGHCPEGVKSIGFYVTQSHIEEVGDGLKLYRDFDVCYFNEGAVSVDNITEDPQNPELPAWVPAIEVDPDTFTLSGVEVVFGDEIELPEGYEVYWISLQPEMDVMAAFAIRHRTECPKGKWFIPES